MFNSHLFWLVSTSVDCMNPNGIPVKKKSNIEEFIEAFLLVFIIFSK